MQLEDNQVNFSTLMMVECAQETRNLHKKLAWKIWRKFVTVSCTTTTSLPITLHGSCHVLDSFFPGGTAAAAPPPFRPGNPALCGSRPLVTPYYCRLVDVLCYTCMLYFSTFLCVYMHVNFVFSLFFVLFSFVASFSTLILLVGSFDL